jgi:CheY-like chemotaxis protein
MLISNSKCHFERGEKSKQFKYLNSFKIFDKLARLRKYGINKDLSLQRFSAQMQMNRVLVVDDSIIGRHVVEGMLSEQHVDIEFAADGQEAYSKAVELKPDLIILDIMMPKIDGIEVAQMIRAHDDIKIKLIPIIILTALDDKDTRNRALKAGANEVLVKPLKKSTLHETIQSVMGKGFYG